MATEDISARYVDLDGWPTLDAVEAMYEGQLSAVAAVRPVLAAIARAAEDAADGLQAGGRLVYAGAGTSGRVAVQDGAELPPTFDWPHDQLVFAMAGGNSALIRSAEGAEDDEKTPSPRWMRRASDPRRGDRPRRQRHHALHRRADPPGDGAGCGHIGVANNRDAPLLGVARHPVLIETGAEVVAGSTRMKAGTAQKIVLNLLSTAIMIRLGRVYRGMMVHMQATNAKLHRRAAIMVALITGCTEDEADKALRLCGFDVKVACLIVGGLPPDEAGALLDRHKGNLRDALSDLGQIGASC